MPSQSKPATRVTYDVHAFLHEEKFDKWLDLQVVEQFREQCEKSSKWMKEDFKHINHIVSPDTIGELHHLEILPHKISQCHITPILPAMLISHVLQHLPSRSHCSNQEQRNFDAIASKAAFNSCNHQVAHLMSQSSPRLKQLHVTELSKLLNKLTVFSAQLHAAQCFQEDMLKCLEMHKRIIAYSPLKSVNQRAQKRVATIGMIQKLPSISGEMIITHDISILHFATDDYLLDSNMFLQIINKSSELVSLLTYAWVCSGTTKPINHHDIISKFIEHICNKILMFKKRGVGIRYLPEENRGFVYLKTMEGLGVAELIRRSDRIVGWENDTLALNLWKSIYDENLDNQEHYFSSVLWGLFSEMTTSQIASIIGIVKIAGHPSIEIIRGLQKLNQRVHEAITINPDAVNRSMGVLKRELMTNFYKRHKVYPNINMESVDLNEHIRRLVERNIDPDSNHGLSLKRNIDVIGWNSLSFLRNELFDPIDNQLTLLKDKALGLCRSQVLKLFLTGDHPSQSYGNMETRRALLMYLLSNHFQQEFTKYLNDFQHDDPWSKVVTDYLVIKLTPKELELKVEGRMFGASHLLERNRRIVQDMNIMHLMDCYISDQLMTPDELHTIRKLYSFRHLKSVYPNHTIVQVSFDFSKWNNSMRAESIDVPGAEVFDKWFGTQCYGKTMRAFENMLVYYKDPIYSEFWDGQLGGIEGLAQATWSSIFIGGIKQALENLGVIYQLTVKGDDVRAALICDNPRMTPADLVRFRDRTLAQLQQLCHDMGWQLNPNECFVSVGVICTSKQYQFYDTWLPADDKKMMKCESLANLIFPTVEDIVSSVFSTAHSSCSQATAVIPAFITASYLAARVLYRDLQSLKIDHDYLTTMLLWPQVLGGPGSLPLQTFIVRGENDMLSVSISLLRHVVISDDGIVSELCMNILNVPMCKDPNLNQLLSDPYSLPLDIPERPSQVLKNLMHGFLTRWTKNRDVLRLLNHRTKRDKSDFAKLLLSMDPYYPKLATAIWECTPFVLVDEIIAKFMQSSTIFAFFSRGKSGTLSSLRAIRILGKVLQASHNRRRFWVDLLRNKRRSHLVLSSILTSEFLDYAHVCTTKLVSNTRDVLWGKNLKGITYPSLVDQNILFHPQDLTGYYPGVRTDTITSQAVILKNAIRFQTPDDNSWHYASSPDAVPWLGSATQSKLVFPKFDYRVKSPTLSKILKLVGLLRSGAYFGKSFGAVLTSVISGLTNVGTNRLHVLQPESGGGHLCHRVAINAFSMNTMPNYRPNLSQIININNESLRVLQADKRDRTINFAARHFFLVVMCMLPLQASAKLPDDYPSIIEVVFHNDLNFLGYRLCPHCCAIAQDEEVLIDLSYLTDLSEYRELALVGCSSFETTILESNIVSAVVHKARHHIIDKNLDIHNVRVQLAAFEVTMRSIAMENSSLYNAARAAMFDRIPQGELLNILSCNFIGASSDRKVSMRLLRSIPANQMYINVVNHVYQGFLKSLSSIDDIKDLMVLQFIQSHMASIAGLFVTISNAGCLKTLSDGCAAVNVIDQELIWPVGSSINGAIACRGFIEHHIKLFERWWMYGGQPLFTKYFVRNEDKESIRNELYERFDHIRIATSKRILLGANKLGTINRIIEAGAAFVDLDVDEFSNVFLTPDNVVDNAEDFAASTIENVHNHRDFDQIEIVVDFSDLLGSLLAYYGIAEGPSLSDPNLNYTDTNYSYELLTNHIGQNFNIPNLTLQRLAETSIIKLFHSNINLITMLWLINIGRTITMVDVVMDPFYQIVLGRLNLASRWVVDNMQIYVNTLSFESAEVILNKLSETVNPDEVLRISAEPDRENVRHPRYDPTRSLCLIYHCPSLHFVQLSPLIPFPNQFEEDFLLELRNQLTYILRRYEDRRRYFDAHQFWRISPTINQATSAWINVITILHGFNSLTLRESSTTGIVIGDGTGSISRILLERLPHLHIIFCSLALNPQTGKLQSDASVSNAPYEFTRSRCQHDILDRLIWSGMFPGDITSLEVQEVILRHVLMLNNPVPFIMCDAEPPIDGYWDNMIKIISSILTLHQKCFQLCASLFIKIKIDASPQCVRTLNYLGRIFSHFHMYYPPSIPPYSHVVILHLSEGVISTNIPFNYIEYAMSSASLYVDEQWRGQLRTIIEDYNVSQLHYIQQGFINIDIDRWRLNRTTSWWFQPPNARQILDFIDLAKGSVCDCWCNIQVAITRDLIDHAASCLHLLRKQVRPSREPTRPWVMKPNVVIGSKGPKVAEMRTFTLEVCNSFLRSKFIDLVLTRAGFNPTAFYEQYRAILNDWVLIIYDLHETSNHFIRLNQTNYLPILTILGAQISINNMLTDCIKMVYRFVGQYYHINHYIHHHRGDLLGHRIEWWSTTLIKECCIASARNEFLHTQYPFLIQCQPSVLPTLDGRFRLYTLGGSGTEITEEIEWAHPLAPTIGPFMMEHQDIVVPRDLPH